MLEKNTITNYLHVRLRKVKIKIFDNKNIQGF